MTRYLLSSFLSLTILGECVAQGPARKGILAFEDVTDAVGLKGVGGGNAAWGDFDNDGWVDLYTGGQLWRNEQGKRFVRVTGVPLTGPGIWGDFDNDGFLDLFTWSGRGRLFRNLHGKGFQDISKNFPGLPMPVSLGAVWGDFDGDGFLDLYVGGFEASERYLPHAIFRNRGDGTFTEAWRTKNKLQPARGVTAADFDEDGHLDVYVSNYRLEANLLWHNDGKGGFRDVARGKSVAGAGHTIGSAFGDFDNDGHLDLFVGNLSHPPRHQDRCKFLRNLGPTQQFRFEDRSKDAGLHWQESYGSPALADFDNDGLLDLFLTTVYRGDRSVLYRNTGDWKFTNVSGPAKISTPPTFQAAWADFDNDGYLDLITGGKLYRNPGGKNHWLKVRLQGSGKVNRAAMGAQVRVKLGKHTLTRQVESATGEGNQNDLALHYGLGEHAGAVDLEIRWTDGSRQHARSPVDRTITIAHGARK